MTFIVSLNTTSCRTLSTQCGVWPFACVEPDVARMTERFSAEHAEPLSVKEISMETLGGRRTKPLEQPLLQVMCSHIRQAWGVSLDLSAQSIGVLRARSAAFHHDPYVPDVAYVNWYIQGPPAEFRLGSHVYAIAPGALFVFDPYCPHALTTPAHEQAVFLSMEIPLMAVEHVLGVTHIDDGPNCWDMSRAKVDPHTGALSWPHQEMPEVPLFVTSSSKETAGP